MKILKKVERLTQYLKKLDSIQRGGSDSIVGLVNSAMELKEKDILGKTLDNMELRKEVEKLQQNSAQLKNSLNILHNGIEGVKPNLRAIIEHFNKNIESQNKMKEMIDGIKRLSEIGFDKIVAEIKNNANEFETSESNNIVPPLDLSQIITPRVSRLTGEPVKQSSQSILKPLIKSPRYGETGSIRDLQNTQQQPKSTEISLSTENQSKTVN